MDLVQNQDIIIDGHVIRYVDGLYSLNDLHKASGGNPSHRPANFLKTKEVKDLIAEIESSNYDATILASKNTVAEFFGKRHDNVLRAIERLECSEKFNALNFEVVKYIDQKGQARTMYNMTKDGFTLLAMGFTGKKALFGVSFLF